MKQTSQPEFWSLARPIALVVFCLWIAFGIAAYLIPRSWPTKGQVGDSFGVLNSLFSGLAFAGVVTTLILQHKELSDSKQEQADSRKRALQTARLNALSTLVSAHSDEMTRIVRPNVSYDGTAYKAAQDEFTKYSQKITSLLSELEKEAETRR